MSTSKSDNRILRADDRVEIQFARYHTHVTPEEPLPKFKEDLAKGILEMKWYDAADICIRGCYGKIHYGWDGEAGYGGWARINQDRSQHRCRFISEVVPKEWQGEAVTFAGPMAFDLHGGQSAPILLHVHGTRTESTCIMADLSRKSVRGEYDFHFTFHPVRVGLPDGAHYEGYEFVTGIAHIRVFPNLVPYGQRMIFEFQSPIAHHTGNTGLTIGHCDSTRADIPALQAANGVTDEKLLASRERIAREMIAIRDREAATIQFLKGTPRVEVNAANRLGSYDRGERRVTMYPSWIGIGTPHENAAVTSEKLTRLMGQPFDLFRYQGHISRYDYATGEFAMDPADRREWEIIAGAAKDVMFSGGPHHPFLTLLRSVPESDYGKVVAGGVAEMTWDRITDNYVRYVAEARAICPAFTILQMPYELDNASETAEGMDIHYRFYQCCYRAAHETNARSGGHPLRVAGPSFNNYNTGRWTRWMDGFLARYAADKDPRKRLDFLAYHCYQFPQAIPRDAAGQEAPIRQLLESHGLDPETPVIIDEAGIAEFSIFDEYLDLVNFSNKQLASACWLLAIQHWYLRESKRFHPVTGDGWHFGSLCMGKQGALTNRAKALLLRHRMPECLLESRAEPQTVAEGYGLYSMASSGEGRMAVLVWNCSPGTFLPGLLPVRYPGTEVVISNIPEPLRGKLAKLTIHSLDLQHGREEQVLTSPKCLKLQKIDRERYAIDFTPEEVADLDHIHSTVTEVRIPANGEFRTTLDVEEHGIYLIELEGI
ncbi:MAG: hypothetical protein NTV93_16785 [Verrucomicrobia bacterium]|nr:hypothetical protein [Verrucomicrobiota bacterium]